MRLFSSSRFFFRTFWEETGIPVGQVLPQEPAITKFVVSLGQLYAISFGKTQFVGTSSLEVVCAAGTKKKLDISNSSLSQVNLMKSNDVEKSIGTRARVSRRDATVGLG